ncbi:unnamed protein product [Brassica oleracea var. botrytis]
MENTRKALDWKLRHKLACAPAEQGAAGDGEGNFMCGSKQCHEIEGLLNLQVNFSYHEAGEHKQALVKLVTCERCAEKLYYKRRKDAERSESKEKKRQKRKRNRSSSEDDIEEEERRKGKKNKSKLEGCEREGKDDENFDEFMEGMFPGKVCHFRFPHHHSNGYCHATKEQIDGVYSEKVDYSSPEKSHHFASFFIFG